MEKYMFKINNDIRTASINIAVASLLLTLSRFLPTEKFKKILEENTVVEKVDLVNMEILCGIPAQV